MVKCSLVLSMISPLFGGACHMIQDSQYVTDETHSKIPLCAELCLYIHRLAIGKLMTIAMPHSMCSSFKFFLSSFQPLGCYPRYLVLTEISSGKFFLVHFPSYLFSLPCSVSFYASFTLLSSLSTHWPPWERVCVCVCVRVCACMYVCARLSWNSPEPLADEFP